MRILYWTKSVWPLTGGMEMFASRLIPDLMRRGHDLHLFAARSFSQENTPVPYADVSFYGYGFRSSLAAFDLPLIGRIVQKLKADIRRVCPDLVHLQIGGSDPGLFFFERVRDVIGVPIVTTVHSLPGQDQPWLFSRIAQAATRIVAPSGALLEKLTVLDAGVANKAVVIPNGSGPNGGTPEPLDFDRPRVLCLGRLEWGKGFDLAIRAMPIVKRSYPNMELTIAGDGPERAALERLAVELGVRNSIRFAGWLNQEEAASLINRATIVAIPSRDFEAFGLVAIESAQAARPVVAANIGGLPEVVVHDSTGFLFDVDNHKDLAGKIEYLVTHPDVARELGAAGRRQWEVRYSLETHVSAYEALFSSLVTSSP